MGKSIIQFPVCKVRQGRVGNIRVRLYYAQSGDQRYEDKKDVWMLGGRSSMYVWLDDMVVYIEIKVQYADEFTVWICVAARV